MIQKARVNGLPLEVMVEVYVYQELYSLQTKFTWCVSATT
jgi:hypothetical protein